jgi:hypothetical protein
LAFFEGVGRRITGDRRRKRRNMGYDCLHVPIDDATRLAYVEEFFPMRKGGRT